MKCIGFIQEFIDGEKITASLMFTADIPHAGFATSSIIQITKEGTQHAKANFYLRNFSEVHILE